MKSYPEEFKREAVELLRTNGRPLAQIARELGVSAGSLRLWRKQAEIDAGEREVHSSEEGKKPPKKPMVKRPRIWFSLAGAVAAAAAVVFFLVPLACGGGDDGPPAGNDQQAGKVEKPVDGSFVGEVSGTEAFVAVVAAPDQGTEAEREIQIYIADGRRLSEWFVGSISNNGFVATSEDGNAQAKGKLSGDSVAGSVELPDGETVLYTARRPTGAAGLYDLTMSRRGKLTGASTGGLGVTGTIKLADGTGTLKLADGRRLKFDIAEGSVDDLGRLQAGELRLIVLPGGQLAGVGKSRPAADSSDSAFFISSS